MDVDQLAGFYRDQLLNDSLPFWISNAVDRTNGGFLTALARNGNVIDTDKSIWQQGRFTWLLATLYNEVEPCDEWLGLAAHGIDFIEQHAFDDNGDMYFLVTREGKGLRMRRYVYAEAFAAMAFAAYAKASKLEQYADRARALFGQFQTASIAPKVDPDTRPMKSIGPIMIAINVAQTLRATIGFSEANAIIDQCIEEINRDFFKRDRGAVMETVGLDGRVIDHFDGRLLNPGHAIEAGWFILEEGRLRNDPTLVDLGIEIIDVMWERGWDEEYGGLRSFCDLDGKPPQEYCHDMKLWWPHNEAIIATLLAYDLTGDPRHATRHGVVHDWAHKHFADRDFGEWFGYLRRDGSVSVDLKGNQWKGPFHLPRMQLRCWQIAERLRLSSCSSSLD